MSSDRCALGAGPALVLPCSPGTAPQLQVWGSEMSAASEELWVWQVGAAVGDALVDVDGEVMSSCRPRFPGGLLVDPASGEGVGNGSLASRSD